MNAPLRRAVALTASASVVPDGGAGPDWFDPVRHLGPRGWKYHTPAIRYLLAAARRIEAGGGPGLGVSIGTQTAVTGPYRTAARQLAREGVRGLSPAEAPNLSVNMPASRLAIERQARAFCLTFTDPLVGGLIAVARAADAIAAGRASTALAGATEEAAPGLDVLPGACLVRLEDATAAPADATLLAGSWCGFLPRTTGGAGRTGGDEPAGGGTRRTSPDAVRYAAARIADLAAVGGQDEARLPYVLVGSGAGTVAAALDAAVRDGLSGRLRTADGPGPDALRAPDPPDVRDGRGGPWPGRVTPVVRPGQVPLRPTTAGASVAPMLLLLDLLRAGTGGLLVAADEHGQVAALRLRAAAD